MRKFIDFEKMSKKEKIEYNKKRRTLWQTNPVTKIVQDKTQYSRKGRRVKNAEDTD